MHLWQFFLEPKTSQERRKLFVETCTSFLKYIWLVLKLCVLKDYKGITGQDIGLCIKRSGHWLIHKEVTIKFQTHLHRPGANSPRIVYDQRQDYHPEEEEEERRLLRKPITFLPIYIACYYRVRKLSSVIYITLFSLTLYLIVVTTLKGKGKGKVHPRRDHERPEGEQRFSCILSLTSTLDGEGGQHHAPAALPPGKDSVPIVQEAGWVSEPVWTGAKNLAPTTGIRPPGVQPVVSRYTD